MSTRRSCLICVLLLLAPVPTALALHDGPNRPPFPAPIEATMYSGATIYTMSALDLDQDTYTYVWNATFECGTFDWPPPEFPPNNTEAAMYAYRDCPAPRIHVEVRASDGHGHTMLATYDGIEDGSGEPGQPVEPDAEDPVDQAVEIPVVYGEELCPVGAFRATYAPTQGVWQDDDVFEDGDGRRIAPEGPRHWRAELDMVQGRPTLLFGQRAERFVIPIHAALHGSVRGETDLVVAVRVAEQETILERIDLGLQYIEGRCGNPHALDKDIDVFLGIPSVDPYTFPKTNAPYEYAFILRLESRDGRKIAGADAEVRGMAVPIPPLRLAFIGGTMRGDASGADDAAEALAAMVPRTAPRYLPIAPGDIAAVAPAYGPYAAWLDLGHEALVEAQKECAEAALRNGYIVPSWCSGSDLRAIAASLRIHELGWHSATGRIFVILTHDEYLQLFPGATEGTAVENPAGRAVTSKVGFLHENADHWDVAHLLAHMVPQAGALGDGGCGKRYHLEVGYGNGFQVYSEIQGPGGRAHHDRITGILGPEISTRERYWIEQCTYHHLLRGFQALRDPKVVGITGWLGRDDATGLVAGGIASATTFDSDVDLEPGDDGAFGLVFLGADGAPLATFSWDQPFAAEGVARPLEAFAWRIEPPAGATQVVLGGPTGPLDTLDLSANPPTISFVEPPEGTLVDGASDLEVTWTTTDPDGDRVRTGLFVSVDAGETWSFTEATENASSARIPRAVFAAASEPLLKLVASDGYHGATAIRALRAAAPASGTPPPSSPLEGSEVPGAAFALVLAAMLVASEIRRRRT